MLDALQENSGGTAEIADKISASELQGFLSDIEKDAKAQQCAAADTSARLACP